MDCRSSSFRYAKFICQLIIANRQPPSLCAQLSPPPSFPSHLCENSLMRKWHDCDLNTGSCGPNQSCGVETPPLSQFSLNGEGRKQRCVPGGTAAEFVWFAVPAGLFVLRGRAQRFGERISWLIKTVSRRLQRAAVEKEARNGKKIK